MIKKIFSSLKGRLYLLIFLAILPCYALILINFNSAINNEIEKLRDRAEFVTKQSVLNQQNIINGTNIYLRRLAESAAVNDVFSKNCIAFVKEQNRLNMHVTNIVAFSVEGHSPCVAVDDKLVSQLAQQPFFLRAVNTKTYAISQMQVDPSTGTYVMAFAYPIFGENNANEINGVAVVVVSVEWWGHFIQSVALPENSVAYILDRNDKTIFSLNDAVSFAPYSQIPNGAMQIGSDDVRRLFFRHQLRVEEQDISLTFVTGISIDKGYNLLLRSFYYELFSFTVFVAIVLISLWYFFRANVQRPLNNLSTIADALGEGKEIQSDKKTGIAEMDSLRLSLLNMAGKKRSAEKELRKQASRDPLTGLANRSAFNALAQRIVDKGLVSSSPNFAVIYIDLDNFKEINDTRGHEVGDKVLHILADRLSTQLPENWFIARQGGDEFTIIVDQYQDSERVVADCQTLLQLISEPIQVSPFTMSIMASVGLAFYPEDADSVSDIMSAADQAMYAAKSQGKNRVCRFDFELKSTLIRRTSLIEAMRVAIEKDELQLHFQPIVDDQNRIVKFESLLRWTQQNGVPVSPAEFIPLAEHSGLIIDIGHWVIDQALAALPHLRLQFGDDIQVSVNVSPLQLSGYQGTSNALVQQLLASQGQTNSAKHGIVIEITESLLMSSDDATRAALRKIQQHGIDIALDDFGTGYSSMSYMLEHRIDILKIDRSFVQHINSSKSSYAMCEAMILLSHKLGMKVVAEGVETKTQADLLFELGCDFLQGFYISKPQPLTKIFCCIGS